MVARDKQTENKRADGKFAPGNKLGNKFKAGVSANPNGRPKLITLSEAFRRQLSQVDANDVEGRTYAEVIAEKLCIEAASGNVLAAREVADRTEGKPKQTVDLDLQVSDWRELARNAGLTEAEVVIEARRLIESAFDPSDA